MASPDDDLRYERKLVVATADTTAVCSLVKRHPALFRELFPPRVIDNIYLDTPSLAAYRDNFEGNPDREKVRVRWYGEYFREVPDGVLEIKMKRGTVGLKRRFAMPPFSVDEHLGAHALCSLVRTVEGLPSSARALIDTLEAASGNAYRRRYFLSADGRFRATVDDRLTFMSVARRRGPRVCGRVFDRVVLEIKYHRESDGDADRVCSWFPFRIVRQSKYVSGIDAVRP